MARAQYLIDTNAIIDYLGGKLPNSGKTFLEKIITKSAQVSVITKIELLAFNTTEEHSNTLSNFINGMKVIALTVPIVDKTILIRKRHIVKLPDAIIAATALNQNSILVTRNISDFRNIKNLKTLNPHAIS